VSWKLSTIERDSKIDSPRRSRGTYAIACESAFPAGAGDLAARRSDAGEDPQEAVLAVALEPGDADELAGADLDVDRLRVREQADRVRAQHDLRAHTLGHGHGRRHLRARVLDARHLGDEVARAGLAALEGRDGVAGAHHGDAVGDLLDFVHAVGDVEHADAPRAQ
jgi:hypothetical protein